jgi:hypothetical protein
MISPMNATLTSAPQIVPDTTHIEWVVLDDLECPAIRAGVDYWRLLRGRRLFPAREDLKPREIAGLLRSMSLIKVADGDFQYRVVGDSIVQAYDVSLQSRWFRDIDADLPTFGLFIRPILTHVVESKAPIAVRGRIGHDAPHVNFTHHENALLPLGPDDDAVDHILVFSNYVLRPALGNCF